MQRTVSLGLTGAYWLSLMLVVIGILLGALALAPTISLYGPRILLWYFRGTVIGVCFLFWGEVTTMISTGAWLIYFSGVVVIFIFFSFRAPNMLRHTFMGTRTAYVVGASASLLIGIRTPLLLGPPPLIALVMAVTEPGLAGSALWTGGLLFLIVLIADDAIKRL